VLLGRKYDVVGAEYLDVHETLEYDWLPWKFRYVSSRFWILKTTHRKYFDRLLLDKGLSQAKKFHRAIVVIQVSNSHL
jgi:hypothetical protein